ncbi:branched-chain amino acid ABC transporter substrate-binding protein [Undibacterium sp.]|jgi:branched-chain amino acid transport system substrate-binding protein|uniref:branched-chain amino acid ABC transporter substrate-binding protein n=1 Tax=Undibacterium sp. TaxID=1914977 RepID=UPI002BFBAA58|nr:branched-chain amino acid ABC transporter substrate-binding protein [Undibacterium sp.]HTD06650.1 branched-chain amino acid ABC transporter substrate-binding protein [Undibacterium sp.]
MKHHWKKASAALSLASLATLGPAGQAYAENVKIAFIDALSGAFAPPGQTALKNFQMVADLANQQKWAGNNTIEVVGFDGKGSPQDSLTQLKTVIDQGYRYVTQGGGSGVAFALIDGINKYNERNPGKELVFLDFAALDPDLTNAKCSFWHFRFEPNSDMRMEALTSFMAKDPNIKKVFIIGQNYALGHQVSRAAKDYLKRKRPDIQIVGDDLHPIATVKDFSPYVAKIKSSGADSVITGNWGNDLALLIKAAKEADLKANFYTYTAYTTGVPTAMGSAGVDRVKNVSNWNINNETYAGHEIAEAFKKKYNEDYWLMSSHSVIAMLSKAIKDTGSTDPVKAAFAMEGMKIKSLNGEVEMRKTDHQAQQPIYITTWTKANGKDVRYDQENTGYGWKTTQRIDSFVASQPTSCEMKRPSR